MANLRPGKRAAIVTALIFLLILYQAPNLTKFAYHLGWQVVDTKFLASSIAVTKDWYPAASSDSVFGKLFLSKNSPPLVIYHRPSLFRPWSSDIFAAINYRQAVDSALVEESRKYAWGRGVILKKLSDKSKNERMVVLPDFGIGLLVEDLALLDAIVDVQKQR